MMHAVSDPLPKTSAFISALIWIGASITTAATPHDDSPYTAWISDYVGDEAHTLGLWKFDNPDPAADASLNRSYSQRAAKLSKSGVQTGVPGKFGEALLSKGGTNAVGGRSTGNDSYASFSSELFNGSAISIEFWYSPLSATPGKGGTYSYFFDKMYTEKSGIMLVLTDDNKLRLTVGNGTKTALLHPPETISFAPGEWYHFAVTYENVDGNGILKLYLNGDLFSSRSVAGFGDLDGGSKPWRLGNRLGSSYGSAPGYYDNFRVSDVAYPYAPSAPSQP